MTFNLFVIFIKIKSFNLSLLIFYMADVVVVEVLAVIAVDVALIV